MANRLFKTPDAPLNRALQLNEQLDGMREKNVILYDQNQGLTRKNREIMNEREGLVQLVTSLNQELEELRKTSMAKEKRLQQELRNMQISWDSLYNEHRAAEERRERELKAKNESSEKEDKISQQAQLLQSAVKKQPIKMGMVSPMEKKLHELEDENKKLKSKVVQLQTKYREEKYKNENGVKHENESVSITDSESVSSTENPTTGGNLLAGFKNRNLGRRQNNARPPKFGQKGLWGRMTNNRNIKEPSSLDFPGMNLAFSRDD